jgi:hypothetical protein
MGAPSSESQLIYRYLFIDEKKNKCWWKRKKRIMGAEGSKQEDVEQMVVPKVSILLTFTDSYHGTLFAFACTCARPRQQWSQTQTCESSSNITIKFTLHSHTHVYSTVYEHRVTVQVHAFKSNT